MNIFEEIKEKLDIRDVYTHYTGNGINRNNKALCCFHRDTHPSLSFKDKIFKCFVCDKGGDVFKFMEYYFGVKGIEAARRLNSDFGLNLIHDKVYDRRRVLLEHKRHSEEQIKQNKIIQKIIKNNVMFEKINNANKYIELLKKAVLLDDEKLSTWAEKEIEDTYAEISSLCDEWEFENREYIKEMCNNEIKLNEWEQEQEKRRERLERKRYS